MGWMEHTFVDTVGIFGRIPVEENLLALLRHARDSSLDDILITLNALPKVTKGLL
jgi:hypothetical protein